MPVTPRLPARVDTPEVSTLDASTPSATAQGYFYPYMGLHSLLIGLLPFFLPVWLWQRGFDLSALALMIGVSGLSFVMALGLWQRMARHWPLKHLVSMGFLLEILLLLTTGLMSGTPGAPLFDAAMADSLNSVMPDSAAPVLATDTLVAAAALVPAACLLGLVNGLYNAFFWTTQRALFLPLLGENDAGRQYGNFQIFVMIVLKIGILLGGLLLETGGYTWLLALSAGCAMVGNHHLASRAAASVPLDAATASSRYVTLRESLRYSDDKGSKPGFIIDGVFLYLESHFWTLTLFLVVEQDFSRLGFAVVALALIFSLLFLLIKNRIDDLPVRRVFRVAVWLYLGSWLLRFTLDRDEHGPGSWSALILLTFCSSFFRLAFNKRFFDMARRTGGQRYLLIKSYSSQFWLACVFLALAVIMAILPVAETTQLQWSYLLAAALCPIYLRYSPRD